MPITGNEFRQALGRFAAGVTVVTTKDRTGKMFGITVSAFCSVSLEPPLILVCIEKKTGSHHAFREANAFIVNILHENQQEVSNHFASHLDDKFTGIDYRLGLNDLPVLNDSLVALECSLAEAREAGDHTIFIGQIERAAVTDDNPLVYFHGKYRRITE